MTWNVLDGVWCRAVGGTVPRRRGVQLLYVSGAAGLVCVWMGSGRCDGEVLCEGGRVECDLGVGCVVVEGVVAR